MTQPALLVIPRDDGFLVISPAEGVCAEHSDLNEAYRLLARRQGGTQASGKAARSKTRLKPLMPFFIKTAAIALAGTIIAATLGLSLAYALHETAVTAGQKAGRAVLHTFEDTLVAQLKRTSPEQQERIHQSLREAAPLLKPYAQDLKPLFE